MQALVMNRFRRDARRGAMFADAAADEPYLLYFAETGIQRAADSSLPRLETPETRGTTFTAIRMDASGHKEMASPEQLLLLRPYDGPKGPALDVIAQSETQRPRALQFAEAEVAGQMARDERERLQETVEERVRFVKQGFRYRAAQLAERRSDLRQQKRDNVPGAEKRYAEIKRQQRALDEREAEAIQTIRREPELIRPHEAEEMACALVVPTSDPDDKERRTDEVEARAMQVAMAHERSRGATVQDVSTPDKARAAGLGDWPGFDVLAEHPGGEVRGIEVKGRARVGDITLSENEWRAAITHRKDFWLYVVYDCATANPQLLRIQDPHSALVATPTGDVVIDKTEIFQNATQSSSTPT
jgi:hypothetical protein